MRQKSVPEKEPRNAMRADVIRQCACYARAATLAEHVARHPEDVGLTVEDFNWTLWTIVRPAA
jgi:hypothetical protein